MYSPLKTASKSRPCPVCSRGDKSCSLGDSVIFCRGRCAFPPDGWRHVKRDDDKSYSDMFVLDNYDYKPKAVHKIKTEANRNGSNSTS